jgi:hypothetical protein
MYRHYVDAPQLVTAGEELVFGPDRIERYSRVSIDPLRLPKIG